MGALVGGEGTLGLLTAITVRLLHVPAGVKTLLASFSAIDDASEAVSAIVGAGIIPAALEMIDETFVRAINEGVGAGYPKGAGAVLLIELDGPAAEIDAQATRIVQICRDHAALEIRVAADEAERALLWKGRKEAAGVVGRMSSTWILQDAVVPRSRLPEIMREVQAIGARHRLVIANVFHAGDGNLHPLILFDANDPDELHRFGYLGPRGTFSERAALKRRLADIASLSSRMASAFSSTSRSRRRKSRSTCSSTGPRPSRSHDARRRRSLIPTILLRPTAFSASGPSGRRGRRPRASGNHRR